MAPRAEQARANGHEWHGWPETVGQLAVLARGLIQLGAASTIEREHLAVIDLDGLLAVVDLIRRKRR